MPKSTWSNYKRSGIWVDPPPPCFFLQLFVLTSLIRNEDLSIQKIMLQIFLKAERKCFQNEGWWGWGVENFQQLHPLWRRERLCMIGYISRSSFILYPISIYIPPFPFGHYCWSTTSTLCCMESLLESRKWLFKSKYTHTLYASKVFFIKNPSY